jgi:hypothetical protein
MFQLKDSLNITEQTTLSQVLEEADTRVAGEDSHDEIFAEESDHFAKDEEPENTASGADDASSKARSPRIGFKHDPSEEAIMANVKLDVGVPQKKKKKKRPKSQRGLVRPDINFRAILILTITRSRPLDLSPSMPMLHSLHRSLRRTRRSMTRM